ncbi:MAG TPA: hypothetical protein VHJ34_07885 [Actinomycetota bacterium]|nr:hypothetical protein [Actinomycetota bacterium]
MPRATPVVWINKRSVTMLELPPHTFAIRDYGWEASFSSAGTMTARFTHGGENRIDVAVGDRLVSSGDEMYLTSQA